MPLLTALRRQSIGVLARFVALGGTGYAAGKLKKNSVTAGPTGSPASPEPPART